MIAYIDIFIELYTLTYKHIALLYYFLYIFMFIMYLVIPSILHVNWLYIITLSNDSQFVTQGVPPKQNSVLHGCNLSYEYFAQFSFPNHILWKFVASNYFGAWLAIVQNNLPQKIISAPVQDWNCSAVYADLLGYTDTFTMF